MSLSQSDMIFYGEREYEKVGSSVSSAGDVDNDGLSDILMGAPYQGATYLFLGSTLSAILAATDMYQLGVGSADYILQGENVGSQSGYSVASAGDVDGDGRDDILIGSKTAIPKFLLELQVSSCQMSVTA